MYPMKEHNLHRGQNTMYHMKITQFAQRPQKTKYTVNRSKCIQWTEYGSVKKTTMNLQYDVQYSVHPSSQLQIYEIQGTGNFLLKKRIY